MPVRLPSLDNFLTSALLTFRRFPLTLLSAIIGTLVVLQIIDVPYEVSGQFLPGYYRTLMTSALGLTFFTALSLFSEYRWHSKTLKFTLQVSLLVLLIIYRITLDDPEDFEIVFRFSMYCLAGHLLVSFFPFIFRYEPEIFWEYNKTLFLRILLAAFYTLVLWGGLSIALVAIDQLFEVHVNHKWYGKLFVILAGIFNTWFFLAGIPFIAIKNEEPEAYPKSLKIFTQFVLLPLISIYLLILYAYILKIIVTRVWPDGWVSWLVLSFSVAGILSLLLIWPIRNRLENRWIRIYSRGFYIALFPLVILLAFAISIRVDAYGITEGRYYVMILAVWLACMAAYFLFSRLKSIKVIPVSLFLIAILSIHGPWSAFNISQHSQMKRFLEIVERNQMIQSGKITPADKELSQDDVQQLVATVDYLNDKNNYTVFQPYFTANLDSLVKTDSTVTWVDENRIILTLMNVYDDYLDPYGMDSSFYYTFTESAIQITGYDYMLQYNFYSSEDNRVMEYELAEKIKLNNKGHLLYLFFPGDTVTIDVKPFIQSLHKRGLNYRFTDQDSMSVTAATGKREAKIIFNHINGSFTSDSVRVFDADVKVLIKNKDVDRD